MIEITCCRTGVRPKVNYGHKGKFKRRFDNLSSLALFIHKAGWKLFYPHIKNELNKEQRRLLQDKLIALHRKHHK